ncbi:hypothetical protein QUA04_29390 [Microcoleus sp. S13_C5]
MTAFFKKYKWTILYWTVLLFLGLYFAPKQNKYYLDQDIKEFRTHYLIPNLVWTFGLLAVGLFVFWIIKTKSIKRSTLWFLSTALAFAFIIFLFQNIFLGVTLFANRQVTKGKVTKTFQAAFMAGVAQTKSNFHLYDPLTGQIIIDRKLVNELYRPQLHKNDKVVLPMRIGLFGVAYSDHSLDDNY